MSSEKRFEDIENKIKEAAENNRIVFEEASWVKMEVLLDKEDKRKPFFWLWFFVPIALLATYGLFVLSKNNDTILAENGNENKIEKINITKTLTTEKKIDAEENNTAPNNNNANNTTGIAKLTYPLNTQNKNAYTIVKKAKSFSRPKKTKHSPTYKNNKEVESYFSQNETNINQTSKTKTSINNADATEDEIVFEKTSDTKKNDIDAFQKTNTDVVAKIKKDSTIIIAKNSTTQKEKKKTSKLLSRFYVLGSAGVDIGSVKLFSFGNSSFSSKYGASMGFDVTKRLSMQAGFYVSRKKYIAGPADYNVKAGSYWSTVPITKVEAACLIYEVPIVLQYHFLQKKSFNVYAGVGISSYIMKTEDYNYSYKRYNVDYTRAYSYSGNQHLFSTALFSAGIEKNITKKFAVQLEPSISVPLKGIGDGTVKLYSTSLLLGIKYKPFNK